MSTNRKKREHHWEYCDECEVWMVVCGTCGNNCCNGGMEKWMENHAQTANPHMNYRI